MDMTTFTPSALHLFGGCGGLPKGFEDAGIAASVINEMERSSAKTLRLNFPQANVVEKPIQECLLKDWGKHWHPVHSYTYPCERYSDASSINGTQTGDELYLEALREGVLLWPEIMAIENVIGMEKFPRVMETWRSLPGYYTTEFRLFGEDFTLQRKARVILLLHRQEYAFSSLERYARVQRKTTLKEYLDHPDQIDPFTLKDCDYYVNRANNGYQRPCYIYDPERSEPVPLFANYKRDRSVYRVRDPNGSLGHRAFSPREVARLHTFPESFQFVGGYGSQYRQIINSVMPEMAYVIGRAIMDYFVAIPSLAKQPKHQGYRMIVPQRVGEPFPISERKSLNDHKQMTLFT